MLRECCTFSMLAHVCALCSAVPPTAVTASAVRGVDSFLCFNLSCRSSRRPLFDPQTGEWLQPEPEATPALQQLLCRPLKHLWQDSPESRARNARWAPAVSEYRQAALQYPLQHAAEAMLTTEPPEQVEQLQSATTTFTATGRYADRGLGVGFQHNTDGVCKACRTHSDKSLHMQPYICAGWTAAAAVPACL